MNKTDFVGHFSDVRNEVGDHLAALAARPKLPKRLSQVSIGALKGNEPLAAGQRLAVLADKLRFEVEGINMAERP